MMHLEDDLKHALARKSAPDGFAARVMSRIDAEASSSPAIGVDARPSPGFSGRSRFTRAIAAGLLITAVAGGWAAQRAIERREGERAREEVLVALHIASSKVRNAQQHIHEIGSH
jgi:hypothetical protein